MIYNWVLLQPADWIHSDDSPRYRRGNRVLVSLVVANIFIYILTKIYYVWRNSSRDKKWNGMTDQDKLIYLETTKDEGNRRLDFRFAHWAFLLHSSKAYAQVLDCPCFTHQHIFLDTDVAYLVFFIDWFLVTMRPRRWGSRIRMAWFWFRSSLPTADLISVKNYLQRNRNYQKS